jgi:hypothetical protein
MDFRFLYDPQRRIFSIGYRLADAEGPARLDASYYDLLAPSRAWPASSPSPRATYRRRTGSTSAAC